MHLDIRLLLAIPYISPLPLKGVFLTCRHLHVARHSRSARIEIDHHAEIELQYVLEGQYLYETQEEKCTLGPGDGMAIIPNVPHWSHAIQEGIRLSARIGINGAQSQSFLAHLEREAPAGLIPFKGANGAPLIAELFKLVLGDEPDIWQREMIGGLLQAWVGSMLSSCFDLTRWTQYSESKGRIAGNRGAIMCKHAADFIYANFHRDINIADISRHVGITSRHLNRIFHQYMGTSVNATLQEVRLAEAFKKLNNNPTLPIKEIAHAVGFANPSYFTQCFKRKYNLLPNQIIQNLSDTLNKALQHFIPVEAREFPFTRDRTNASINRQPPTESDGADMS